MAVRSPVPGPADERIRERYGLLPGRPLILSVGRLSPEKRVAMLLDAAARFTGDAQVAIACPGPDEGILRARADQLGLSGRERFGFVPGQDLPGLYRLADTFAILSESLRNISGHDLHRSLAAWESLYGMLAG